jgi:hypothetical protein
VEQTSQTVAPLDQAGTTTSETGAGSKAEAAVDGAKNVAAQTEEQAGQLAREAWSQAREVMGRAAGETRTQADQQAAKAASGLDNVAEQLRALADGRSDQTGQVGQYASQAADQLAQFSRHLQDRGMQGLTDDIARFARRRPGQFMLLAAATGFIAGRAVRAGQAAREHDQAPRDGALPPAAGYEALGQVPRRGTTETMATDDALMAAPLPPPDPIGTGDGEPSYGR